MPKLSRALLQQFRETGIIDGSISEVETSDFVGVRVSKISGRRAH
jgi:hypothetical protein